MIGSKTIQVKDIMSDIPWKDDVMVMAENIQKSVAFMMRERFQLYGTIIYLMISNGLQEIIMPKFETMNSYGKDFYILFGENERGEFTMKLMQRPEEE